MAVQYIPNGNPDAPSRTTTSYNSVCGSAGAWGTSTHDDKKQLVPANGHFRNLTISAITAPGSGKSWILYLYKNGAVSGLSVAIGNTTTKAMASGTNSYSSLFTAGDEVSLAISPQSTPATTAFSWSVEWVPSDGVSFIMMGNTGIGNLGNNYFMPVNCSMPNGSASEAYTVTYSPLDTCDVLAMYVKLKTAPGVGSSRSFTFRNTASDTSMSVTISGTNTTGNDTVNVQSFVFNDQIVTKTARPTGAPAATTAKVSYAYQPVTYPGEFMITGNSVDSVGASTNYAYIGSGDLAWTTTSGDRQSYIASPYYFTRMTAWCNVNMDVGSARNFRFLRNGSDLGFVARIPDGAKTGSYDFPASALKLMTAGNSNCQIQMTIEGGPSSHRLGFAFRAIQRPPSTITGGF